MGNTQPTVRQLENQLFNIKFTAKQLRKQSTKAEKKEAAAKKTCAERLRRGDVESAKIYATNAIREKQNALNMLRLSSRLDAVASRVETGLQLRKLTPTMGRIVMGMEGALKAMDTEQLAAMMAKFEQQFEDMDVKTATMDTAMDSATASAAPEEAITSLMQEVAAEASLDISEQLATAGLTAAPAATAAKSTAPAGKVAMPAGGPAPAMPDAGAAPAAAPAPAAGGSTSASDLEARLAALRK